MKDLYDLIIVGGGPCGLSAAIAAGQNGLKVALIERKKPLDVVKRSCGQSLISMNEYYLGDLFHYNEKDGRLCFPLNGFSLPYRGPFRYIFSWQFFSPSGNKIQMGWVERRQDRVPENRIGMVYDKDLLLSELVSEAKRFGVKIYEGTEVGNVYKEAERLKVETKNGVFESVYVIGADGTNSSVAKSMGFNKDRTIISDLFTYSFFAQGIEVPDNSASLAGFNFSPNTPPAFLFVFPRPQETLTNVIVLAMDYRVDLKKAAKQFIEETWFSSWFKAPKIIREFAAIETIYTPIKVPFKDNVLIAGDAAACQELENTGAMISGWKAGQAIADAMIANEIGIESKGIREYLYWWEKAYLNSYNYEDYVRCFAIPYVLPDKDTMDYVFSLFTEKLPPCFNPYTAIRNLSKQMEKLIPVIQAERPHILPHLSKMGLPVTELFSPTLRK